VERRRPTPLRCLVASPLPSAPPPLPLLSSLPYHSPLCAVVPRLTARPAATSLPFCPGMTIGRVWFLYCIQYRFHIPVCEECRVHIAPVPFPGRLVVRVVVSTSYPLLPSAPSGKMLPPSENTCPLLFSPETNTALFLAPHWAVFSFPSPTLAPGDHPSLASHAPATRFSQPHRISPRIGPTPRWPVTQIHFELST
jgi:hypothetical protein